MRKLKYSIREALYEKESNLYYPYTFDVLDGNPAAFADSSLETIPQRAEITAVFGLKHVSGSSYRMWARISNPTGTSVTATLALYDASYNYITSVSKTSSNTTIGLDKNTTLSSGTYHLRLSYTADGANYSFEKTYII